MAALIFKESETESVGVDLILIVLQNWNEIISMFQRLEYMRRISWWDSKKQVQTYHMLHLSRFFVK